MTFSEELGTKKIVKRKKKKKLEREGWEVYLVIVFHGWNWKWNETGLSFSLVLDQPEPRAEGTKTWTAMGLREGRGEEKDGKNFRKWKDFSL